MSESPRPPEEKRPVSCKFVELHVLYVPNDQWNVKLNKVPVEAIKSFVSGGFIRVYPDVTLKSLRSKLTALLGSSQASLDKFFFLKCVGHSLALVKSKQEQDVKVKTFAPPYAPQPELYLLRVVESDCSVRSKSLTPDSTSSDQNSCFSFKNSTETAGTKETVKFPHITKSSHQGPPTTGPEEHNQEEEQRFSSSEADCPLQSSKFDWAEIESCPSKPQPLCSSVNNVLLEHKADSLPSMLRLTPKENTSKKKKRQCYIRNRAARDSGVAESLEDRLSDFSLTDWHGKFKESCAMANRSQRNKQVMDSPPTSSQSLLCTHNESVTSDKDAELPSFRADMVDEIKLVQEERRQLEWMRQELLRKGKDLLAQNRHQRNQARDSWKKKYFETKKATIPLEESLKNMRQELETFYSKLLHQLHARKNKSLPKRQGRASVKNELIIQIMTEGYETDDLKRKVEDAKMKLLTEMKLRNQAATELRSLKAELAQKKSQIAHPRTMTYFGFGNTPNKR